MNLCIALHPFPHHPLLLPVSICVVTGSFHTCHKLKYKDNETSFEFEMPSIPSFSDALACTVMETDANKLLHRHDTLSTILNHHFNMHIFYKERHFHNGH